MAYLGFWSIDDYVTFAVNLHDPTDNIAQDGDAVPAYRVYENETTTPIVTGNMALLDGDNTVGFYSEQIQLTAANGFEEGKCYTIYISAAIDSDAITFHHTLQIPDLVTKAEQADAIWDEAMSGHTSAGTSGKALADVLADTGTDGVVIVNDGITAAKIAANAITASEIADAAIDNATFAADVGTAAYASNRIALAVRKVLDELNLDHLMKSAVANNADMTTEVPDGTVLSNIMTKGSDTSDYAVATDSLEAMADTASAAAIADAVWDETLADHTSSGKTGAALNSAASGALGTGAITFTYTLTDQDSAGINAAQIWVTSDAAGDTKLAQGLTDSNGQITFQLDAGTVYVWRQKVGYNFTNPDTETVA